MKTSEKNKKIFWKGKRVSEKVYNQRKMLFEQARNKRGNGEMFKSSNLKTNVNITKASEKDTSSKDVYEVEGRRIIHVKTLGVQMFCRKFQSVLSLTNIVHEKRIGLASIFFVKCNICCSVTGVIYIFDICYMIKYCSLNLLS